MSGRRMFDESAQFYDAIYATFKDYPAEVAKVAQLLRGIDPKFKTLLDVACGTGEHARLLAQAGYRVDGLDLDASFIRIARGKHQAGRFIEADMSEFDLPHRYDVVMCLFSSIGYLRTLDQVERALRCFRKHVRPGGVVIVEPWFEPGVLDPNRTDRITAETNGVRITRTSRMELEGNLSRLHFEYEITDSAGTRIAREVHELGVFPRSDLLNTFRAAGLDPDFDPMGLSGRGLYVATVAS
jgi:SAM-dependent methyltransferase